jgi:hypothetical protein
MSLKENKCQHCSPRRGECPGLGLCRCNYCVENRFYKGSQIEEAGIMSEPKDSKQISLQQEEKIDKEMEAIINISIRSQSLVDGSIPTGGTVASYYAKHRVSYDVDHLLLHMTEESHEIIQALSKQKDWKPYKVKDVIVLGKLGGIEVGFRQMIRKTPIKTTQVQTKSGIWVIPTIEEITSFKAILTSKRNHVRDYLDFAALADTIHDDQKVLEILKSLNEGYSNDFVYEVAKSLSNPNPDDFDEVDLSKYKNLDPKWQDWEKIKSICQKYGELLTLEIAKGTKK